MRFLESRAVLGLVTEAHMCLSTFEFLTTWLLGYERQRASVESILGKTEPGESYMVFFNLVLNVKQLVHSVAYKRVIKTVLDSKGKNRTPSPSGEVARSHCTRVLGGNYY